jgi:hypothetical protein
MTKSFKVFFSWLAENSSTETGTVDVKKFIFLIGATNLKGSDPESRSDKKIRIRPDPNLLHWFKEPFKFVILLSLIMVFK